MVFSKPEEQPAPCSTKLTEGDAAGMLFGYGEGGVVLAAVGPANAGPRRVVRAVGGACSRRVTLWYSESSALSKAAITPSQNHSSVSGSGPVFASALSHDCSCALKQIHVRIPASKQIHAADDHVREMSGSVVVMAMGGGAGGQNEVEANGGMGVVPL